MTKESSLGLSATSSIIGEIRAQRDAVLAEVRAGIRSSESEIPFVRELKANPNTRRDNQALHQEEHRVPGYIKPRRRRY